MGTATATGSRRELRFQTVDDALSEAERLVAAEREGRLACVGNWKLGQALGHLATWANFAHDGYPPEVRAPLPVRMVLRLMRGMVLKKGMMPGVRIGKLPGGTVGLDDIDAEEGLTASAPPWSGSARRRRRSPIPSSARSRTSSGSSSTSATPSCT